jgi:hypothetical protein
MSDLRATEERGDPRSGDLGDAAADHYAGVGRVGGRGADLEAGVRALRHRHPEDLDASFRWLCR